MIPTLHFSSYALKYLKNRQVKQVITMTTKSVLLHTSVLAIQHVFSLFQYLAFIFLGLKNLVRPK
jgi:hypothetical protein